MYLLFSECVEQDLCFMEIQLCTKTSVSLFSFPDA